MKKEDAASTYKKIDLCMANMCYLKKNLPKKRAV